MTGLTFDGLRAGNRARTADMARCYGPNADRSAWTVADWIVALVGELGEMANLVKKVKRGDLSLDAALPALADELGDVTVYLDVLADELGIDLGAATRRKFNAVSRRVESGIFLAERASPGAKRIALERDRQVLAEGFDAGHDRQHGRGELAEAALAYLANLVAPGPAAAPPPFWPWGAEWWKPKDPIRDLERAGALIAAELDRRLDGEAGNA